MTSMRRAPMRSCPASELTQGGCICGGRVDHLHQLEPSFLPRWLMILLPCPKSFRPLRHSKKNANDFFKSFAISCLERMPAMKKSSHVHVKKSVAVGNAVAGQ